MPKCPAAAKKLDTMKPRKVEKDERLHVEVIENDFYPTTEHPVERDHYISFVALLTVDTVVMKKLYPEWGLQVRIPVVAHGQILWHCNQHGLLFFIEV